MSDRFETKRCVKALYKYFSFPFLFLYADTLSSCHMWGKSPGLGAITPEFSPAAQRTTVHAQRFVDWKNRLTHELLHMTRSHLYPG